MDCVDSFTLVLFLMGLLAGFSVGLSFGLIANTLCYYFYVRFDPRRTNVNLFGDEVGHPVLQSPCFKVVIPNNAT